MGLDRERLGDGRDPTSISQPTGPQDARIQQREDGAIIDQIVISPDVYLNASPGQRRDDVVILPEQQP